MCVCMFFFFFCLIRNDFLKINLGDFFFFWVAYHFFVLIGHHFLTKVNE